MSANKAPGSAHVRHHSQPSISKEAILKAEHLIQEAERAHAVKAFEREQAILKEIQDSKVFQDKVQAFEDDLVSSLRSHGQTPLLINSQLSKEAFLDRKTELGQKLALERIEKRVKGFKVNLQREMLQERAEKQAKQPPKSPQLYKSSVQPQTAGQSSPEPQSPRTPRKPHTQRLSSIEKVAMALGDRPYVERPYVELSPTGFAHFPRHQDDEVDWEHVSEESVESTSKQDDGIVGTTERQPKKGFLKSLFGGK
jgi:hypothetical protein